MGASGSGLAAVWKRGTKRDVETKNREGIAGRRRANTPRASPRRPAPLLRPARRRGCAGRRSGGKKRVGGGQRAAAAPKKKTVAKKRLDGHRPRRAHARRPPAATARTRARARSVAASAHGGKRAGEGKPRVARGQKTQRSRESVCRTFFFFFASVGLPPKKKKLTFQRFGKLGRRGPRVELFACVWRRVEERGSERTNRRAADSPTDSKERARREAEFSEARVSSARPSAQPLPPRRARRGPQLAARGSVEVRGGRMGRMVPPNFCPTGSHQSARQTRAPRRARSRCRPAPSTRRCRRWRPLLSVWGVGGERWIKGARESAKKKV